MLALALGRLVRIAKLLIDGLRYCGHRIRRVRQHRKKTLAPLEPREPFIDVILVEINRLRRIRRREDSPNRQFQIHRKYLSRDVQPVANLPVELVCQTYINDRARPVVLPRLQLVLRNLVFRINLEQFHRIRAELCEKIVRLVVPILPSKPLLVDHFLHMRQRLNFLPIVARQIEYKRYLVPHDEPLRRLFTGFAVVKTPPHRNKERQQQQRKANAQYRQNAAPLITKGIFADKSAQCHFKLQEGTNAQVGWETRHEKNRLSPLSRQRCTDIYTS